MHGEFCQDGSVFPNEVNCCSDLFGWDKKAIGNRVDEHALLRGLQIVVVLFEQKSLPTNTWGKGL